MDRENYIDEYCRLRALRIINDADNCTSHLEEYKSLIRRGGPALDDLTTEQIEVLLAEERRRKSAEQ